jgi:hypothetical protein
VKLKLGGGRFIKADVLLETLPSLLPVSTSHIGFWNCKYYTYMIHLVKFK